MKKTLVAVAALATFGTAAFAQSSVTLYGKIDWTLQERTQKTAGVKTATGNRGWEVNSAGLSGSRWGMMGSEDLGGGLKAIFNLQAGFNIDDAMLAQGGRQFGRQAFAGLSGGFGTFTAGRQYSPIDTVWGNYDSQGYTTNSAMGYAWNNTNGIHAEPGRIDSSLYYATPTMGGFRAAAQWAPGENKTPGTKAGTYAGFSVGYGNGPINVDLAYEIINKIPALVPNAIAGVSVKDWTLGASYDFGPAKLFGGYQRATQTGGFSDKGWMAGVGVPFGAFALNVGYAMEKNDKNTASDGKASSFGGQLTYSLSKRTNVYADFRTGKMRPAGATTQATTKDNLYGVGMRHDF